MRQFAQRLFSRIPRSYASLFPIVSVAVVGFISWYEATQGGHSSAAHTLMAILDRMDKAVATSAVFSITILEGGGMVLAQYFKEEGREDMRAEAEAAIEKTKAEAQAENEKVRAEAQAAIAKARAEAQAENEKVRAEAQAEYEKKQARIEALEKRLQESEARNGNKSEE